MMLDFLLLGGLAIVLFFCGVGIGYWRGNFRGAVAQRKLRMVQSLFQQECDRAKAKEDLAGELIYGRVLKLLHPNAIVPLRPWPDRPTPVPKQRDLEIL